LTSDDSPILLIKYRFEVDLGNRHYPNIVSVADDGDILIEANAVDVRKYSDLDV
jgi:hypothetical protein